MSILGRCDCCLVIKSADRIDMWEARSLDSPVGPLKLMIGLKSLREDGEEIGEDGDLCDRCYERLSNAVAAEWNAIPKRQVVE